MAARLILFGSGGHAKVVLEAIRAAHPECEVAILDDDPEAAGRNLLGEAVHDGRAWLKDNWPDAGVVPAIGTNSARSALIDWLDGAGRALASVVHPSAIVSPSISVGAGAFLAPGAIVNAETILGKGAIVNTGASIDHDCRIGVAAHIAPGAHLCGGVRVGARSLIGAGATVIPGVAIGADVVVGAGSVVIADVPDGARVAGCPARPLKG
ncbi:MAG TPA: acetyltransferase [Allosphingosinicella sp.]|jgi:sugar O-acyltransferase (sialic acid O-acetyltransferase NeuD family)